MNDTSSAAVPPEAPERDQKTPRERFLAYAQKRTDSAVHSLKVLSNCGNRSSYQYTPEEADQILEIVGDAYKDLVEAFRGEPKAGPKRITFGDVG